MLGERFEMPDLRKTIESSTDFLHFKIRQTIYFNATMTAKGGGPSKNPSRTCHLGKLETEVTKKSLINSSLFPGNNLDFKFAQTRQFFPLFTIFFLFRLNHFSSFLLRQKTRVCSKGSFFFLRQKSRRPSSTLRASSSRRAPSCACPACNKWTPTLKAWTYASEEIKANLDYPKGSNGNAKAFSLIRTHCYKIGRWPINMLS